MDDINWQTLVIGLRKSFGTSHEKTAKLIGIGRRSIGKYESGERTPIDRVRVRILKLIQNKNLDIKEIQSVGESLLFEVRKREKTSPLKLKYSEGLAELVGIILGDGEIHKDGTIRISFDPKKDMDFLNRRIQPLIYDILKNKSSFESYKRISFGNKGFMRYLETICGLIPGNKFENKWKIPRWCFEDMRYIRATLRGLFDTDGYFGCSECSRSPEIMLGRFSDRCEDLVKSITDALNILNIRHLKTHTKDGRYKIRITSRAETIKIFRSVGSSNIKHITRFLLWRKLRYNAKIEREGLKELCRKTNSNFNINIESINLPFLWANNKEFEKLINEDETYLIGYNTRPFYDFKSLTSDLIKILGSNLLANEFNVQPRSVRKWREGTRNPRYKYIANLFKVAGKNGLNSEDYKVKNAQADNRSPG